MLFCPSFNIKNVEKRQKTCMVPTSVPTVVPTHNPRIVPPYIFSFYRTVPPFSHPPGNGLSPTSLRIFQTLSPINVKIYRGNVVILNIFFLFLPYLAIPRQIRYTHFIPFYK